MNIYTQLLYARPSFWEGAARIFDFGNRLKEYNDSPTPNMADYFAVQSDWIVVGDDIRDSMTNFEREIAQKRASESVIGTAKEQG